MPWVEKNRKVNNRGGVGGGGGGAIIRGSRVRQYLEAIKQHRGNITSLFITLNNPFKVPSKDHY